ncbi:OPT oligopeptide transporter [Fomitiporia mediterranea MF3/22]|uniref:OPT oligopeptide transporter n=1 Tax=Fomitiporia mediterranea (strain MF3/22) TaxID=694068 RepID=R7SGZ1_FOMME|nr:OPT oligopeptide transporter [Fomitiporia mediterranea MF3/22]EJC97675.1 OPT oligopeptide transporter [Fomitiporia mediterranea MF3/22]
MDQKSAPAYVPTLTFTRRRTAPDVPSDVDDEEVKEHLLHLNDPNWDFSGASDVTSLSGESFELDHKHKFASDVHIGPSIGTEPSDFDTESRADSMYRSSESRLHMRSSDAFDDYEDESPYAEVRAAVSNTDDPTMPVNTFRMWFIGIIFTIVIAALNQFFTMRYPSVFVSGLVAQLLALPIGKAFERFLPRTRFNTFGYVWSLNPGPFNIKEHTVITVMASVVAGRVYATDIIATQKVFFNQDWGSGYQILLCLSSQLIGYSFAGLARQFLVWPSAMLWPGALVNCALFNTLHRNYGKVETKHMSRERFFLFAMMGSFVWYWFPGYIFTALSMFNWVCWIAPNNIVINQLFGYSTGLGMGFLTFDWSMISYIASPLVVPWWAQVNTIVAFVIVFWILTPILYYKNVFFAKFLPMSSTLAFDNTGLPYDPTVVIQNGEFNVDAYKSYSPVFIPVTLAMAYAISFASMTGVFVHTFLWYRHDIIRQFRRSLRDQRDVHSRLMSVYPEVPMLWYLGVLVIAFVMGVITIEVFDTKMPVWALVFALGIALIFLLPVGMIQAITNQTVAMQVFAELIAGYVIPGRPVALMIFKTFCFISLSQAVAFLGDLKLGHYMKVPPRTMFTAQIVATILAVFVSLGVQDWMFGNIPDLCSPDQKARFICPSTSTFATAALIWGGIGPARMFSSDSLYQPILYFFLIGAILPIPFYFLARRYPLSPWRFVNVPVLFSGINMLPPATGINYSAWFAMGAVFQYFMRRFHFRWWMRYNYILSAALDSGVAISLIVIFFSLQLPKGGITLDWWGNTVWMKTLDAMGAPFFTLAPGEIFGPSTWS